MFELPGTKPIRRNDWAAGADLGAVSKGEGIDDSSPDSPSDVWRPLSEELNAVWSLSELGFGRSGV